MVAVQGAMDTINSAIASYAAIRQEAVSHGAGPDTLGMVGYRLLVFPRPVIDSAKITPGCYTAARGLREGRRSRVRFCDDGAYS